MKKNLLILVLIILTFSCGKEENPDVLMNLFIKRGNIKVTTDDSRDITSSSATCGGSYAIFSGDTAINGYGVCYGSSVPYNLYSQAHLTEPNKFECNITNLTPNTLYFTKAFIISSSNDTVYGNEISFTTLEGQPNDLIGYWPFNGNANDESGNNNNGFIFGATLTNDKNGNSNCAYYFDGNSYIKLALTSPLNTNDFSVSIWANRTSGSSLYSFPISKGANGDWNYFAIYKNHVGLGENSSNSLTINFIGTINNNTWYHYVVTRSNNVVKVYLNNTLQGSVAKTINLSNDYNWVIGSQNNAVSEHFFTGVIDNIRIYNRALNESEIQTLYYNYQ